MSEADLFGPTPECPALEELIAASGGERGVSAKEEAEAHLAQCSYCTNELAMFREFEAPAIAQGEIPHVQAIVSRLRANSPVPRPSSWARFWNWKVLTPVMVAVAALVIIVRIPTHQDDAPDLSGRESVYRSNRISPLEPTGELREAPSVFRWSPVAGATAYVVELTEVDTTKLWEARVTTPQVDLPDSLRAKLVAPKVVNWQVTAVGNGGAVIATTGTLKLVLRR